MSFIDKLKYSVARNNSLLCVGLDPNLDNIPNHLIKDVSSIVKFNKAIIDATVEHVCCFKPNSAFYESHGADGIVALRETTDYIRAKYPHMPVLLDAKRGDIGNTNKQYVAYAFEYIMADAVTVHPYQGAEAVAPYFNDPDKGVFVLAKTSNPDSAQFQNIQTDGAPLYEKVIKEFLKEHTKGNCFFVAGATYPRELKQIRTLIGEAPLLVPGVGAQGGDVKMMVEAAVNSEGEGLIINASRGVLYKSSDKDFAEAAEQEAKRLKEEINQHRPAPKK